LGNQHQIDYYNNIAEETALPIILRFNGLTVCSSSQFLLSALNKRSSILDFSLASSFSIVSLILRCIPNNENSTPTGTSNSAQTENLELKLKDLGQLEIRLKKGRAP
jgi:hypothetical protein